MNAKALVEVIRPINDIMSAFAVFISGIISKGWLMPLASVISASVGTFFASAGGMVINDYFDYDIDLVNKPYRPIPRGKLSRKAALYFSMVLFACAAFCVVFTNIWCIIVGIPALVLIILYSWKLKRTLLKNVAVAGLSALALLYGGIASGSIQLVSILSLIAFFASVSREMAKDIEDIEGDRLGGSQSVPVVAGVGITSRVAGLFLVLAVALSFLPYLFSIFGAWYVAMIIPVDVVMSYVAVQLFLKRVERISLWQKTLKIGMYVTLGIFLVSRLIS